MSISDSNTRAAATSPEPMGDKSVGQLLGRMTSDLSHLFHDELELAKVEIKEEVTKAGTAAGLFGGTGVAALFALLMFSFAAAWGLAEIIPIGYAFLIMGALYAVIAVVTFVVGRQQISTVNPIPQQTVETLQEDIAWAKQQKS